MLLQLCLAASAFTGGVLAQGLPQRRVFGIGNSLKLPPWGKQGDHWGPPTWNSPKYNYTGGVSRLPSLWISRHSSSMEHRDETDLVTAVLAVSSAFFPQCTSLTVLFTKHAIHVEKRKPNIISCVQPFYECMASNTHSSLTPFVHGRILVSSHDELTLHRYLKWAIRPFSN